MKHYLFLSFVALASTLITGCATGRQIQFVDRIQRDTLYINKVHYDSIYISHDRTTDYHRGFQSNESVSSVSSVFSPPSPDTLFIHDRTVEHRYRLLRDTIYKVQIDSIPYEVTVVETKAERYVPWWAKLLSWIGAIALILLLARLLLLLRGR